MPNTAKKQRVREGDVLAIRIGDGQYAFARVFDSAIGVYDKVNTCGTPPKDLGSRFMFITCVYTSALTSGAWPKVGKDPRPMLLPVFCKIDALSGEFSIYDPLIDSETPSTQDACKGMEQLAVWHKEIIEDRIRDALAGTISVWLKDLPWVPDALEYEGEGRWTRVRGSITPD